MKTIIKHIVRNMKANKLRTLIIIVTVFLSTAVLFVSLSLNTIIGNTYHAMLQGAHGNADVIITKDNAKNNPSYDPSDLNTKDMSAEDRLDVVHAAGKSYLDHEQVNISLTGLDLVQAKTMDVIKPVKTAEHFSLDGENIIISDKTASEQGLGIGDTLDISIQDTPHTFKIGAIAETAGVFYQEPETIQAVAAAGTIQDIVYMGETHYDTTYLDIPDSMENFPALTEDNPGFSFQKTAALGGKSGDEDTLQAAMIAAISIIILISGYVIISLSKVIVTERKPVIGTFRSIGASKRMVNFLLATEFLLYGLMGASFGMVAAYFLLPPIADLFNEYKAYGVQTEVTYHPGYLFSSFFFGVIFPVAVSLFHILPAGKIPLKDMILDTPHAAKGRSNVSAVTGVIVMISGFILYFTNSTNTVPSAAISFLLVFLGIIFLIPSILTLLSHVFHRLLKRSGKGEMLLGIKNIADNRTASTNSTMIIVVFLLMLMVGITGKGLDSYVTKTMDTGYDIIMSDLQKDPSSYEKITSLNNVETTDVQYTDVAAYDIDGHKGEFAIISVDDVNHFADFYNDVTFENDTIQSFSRSNNGVIIDTYQKDRYDIDKGDIIKLHPDGDNNKTVEVPVAGVMNSAVLNSNKTSVLMHQENYRTHFATEAPEIAVKVSDDAEPQVIKDELNNMYHADASIHTFDEMIEGQKDTIDTLLNGIFIIVLLGLLIGLLGITNNFIVSFIQRKKEYAVLYSVSMSRKQLINMLFYEMLMAFISLTVIGLAGGYLLYIAMEKLLHALGLVIPMTFQFGLFGILAGASFLLLALSGLSTIRRVKRMNILKQLRYE